MKRPDPTAVNHAVRGLAIALPGLLEATQESLEAIIEMDEYEGDAVGMKAIDAKYRAALENIKLEERHCRVADLVGVSAFRTYAVEAIEYELDLFERMVQLLENPK